MKKFFVIGRDIGYSLSPKIFGELFKIFGDEATYSVMDMPYLDLKRCSDADGFNVTKPYKVEIMDSLKKIMSDCGSVNTVTTHDMAGYSTDGDGFLFDLERNFAGASKAKLLVIGYGGAARACVSALIGSGADIRVIGRDKLKAKKFSMEMGVEIFDESFVPEGVISCVSGTFVPPVKPKFCYDLRYAGETLRMGCSANGLGMLIAQAIYSYCIFMRKRFDNGEVERLYLRLREIL